MALAKKVVYQSMTPEYVIRHANDRGHENYGWLDTWHTFSFSRYFDSEHMGYRVLRVINDDRVQPKTGFPLHGHKEMEILSYVLEGELTHEDSTHAKTVIRPGGAQVMTTGSGIIHTESNQSDRGILHFLQVWLVPGHTGLSPRHAEKFFPVNERENQLRLIASPRPEQEIQRGSLQLFQDARIYASILRRGALIEFPSVPHRHYWIQVASGHLRADSLDLHAGDGLAVHGTNLIRFEGTMDSEFLLFDLD